MIAENSSLGVVILDNHTPVFINKAFTYLTGLQSINDLKTVELINLVHPDCRASVLKFIDTIRQNVSNNSTCDNYQLTIKGNRQYKRTKFFDLRFCVYKIEESVQVQILVIDIIDEMEREKIKGQLASESLYLTQMNDVLIRIRKEINSILRKNEYSSADLLKIQSLLDSNTESEMKWGFFNANFENLHPEFISNLKKINPTLSVKDIKHCACIRLDFDTKEIAAFFNISPSSIQKARGRLKKKLNLSMNVDLRGFISTL